MIVGWAWLLIGPCTRRSEIDHCCFTDAFLMIRARVTSNPEIIEDAIASLLLPTRCPVARRFGSCQCYFDLAPNIRQNGERRSPGRLPGFVFRRKNAVA